MNTAEIQAATNGNKIHGTVEIKYINGTIIFNVLDKDFFDNLNIDGGLFPEVIIENTPIKIIIINKENSSYQKVLQHELQHFINFFFINFEGTIENQILSLLQDETIAQTIKGSYGNTADAFISGLTYAISQGKGNYAFGNQWKNTAIKMYLNQYIFKSIEIVKVAYTLRNAGIKNYQHILATTPFLQRPELPEYKNYNESRA